MRNLLLNMRGAQNQEELITQLRGMVVYLISRCCTNHLPGLPKYHQEIPIQKPHRACICFQEVQMIRELCAKNI